MVLEKRELSSRNRIVRLDDSLQIPASAIERLAVALLALRVFMECSWGSIVRSNLVLASLHFDAIVRCIVLALCLLILARRSTRLNILFLCLSCFGMAALVVSAIFALDSFVLIDFLVVAAVSFVHPRKLCKTYLLAVSFAIAAVMFLSLVGYTPMVDVIPNGRLVFGYGFIHPNVLGGLFLSVVCAQTYYCWESKWWGLAPVEAVLFAAFAKAVLSSNASAILILFVGAIGVIGHFWNQSLWHGVRLGRASTTALIAVPLVLMLGMLVLVANYKGLDGVAAFADGITHYRPRFASNYYEANGGFTLFGRPFVSVPAHHNGGAFSAVDSAYAYFSLVFGIFPLIVCGASYVACIIRAKRGVVHPFLLVAILLFAVFALVEGLPMHLYSNVTLLLLPCLARTGAKP